MIKSCKTFWRVRSSPKCPALRRLTFFLVSILEPRGFSLTKIKSTFLTANDGCTSKFPPLSLLRNALSSDDLFGAFSATRRVMCNSSKTTFTFEPPADFLIFLPFISSRTTLVNRSWLDNLNFKWCSGQLTLPKITTTQQLVCVQFPCIPINNDFKTRIYLATIRSYCFLQDSLKIVS